MGEIKTGKYGRYYEYTDETGAKKTISAELKDYKYKHIVITETDMELMLRGEEITKDKWTAYGAKVITIWLKPYTSVKTGKETKILDVKDEKFIDDRDTIKKYKDIIIGDTYVGGSKIIKRLRELPEIKRPENWKCEHRSFFYNSFIYEEITIINSYDSSIEPPLDVFYQNDEKTERRIKEITSSEFNVILEEYDKAMAERDATIEKLEAVRHEIYQQFHSKGLEEITNGIELQQALDFGDFRQLQKLVVKNKFYVENKIIYEAFPYPEVEDEALLQKKILCMLKLYLEFTNINEKNVREIAAFVAKHKISALYEDILAYDDALEPIIDNTDDKTLLKDTLVRLVKSGKSTGFLKDKSFYFEKIMRCKKIIPDMEQLVMQLKTFIPTFNERSDVAIMTDIVLNTDGTITYQFYSYSGDATGSDMDGRRLLYLTKLYNQHHKDHKVFFVNANSPDDTDDIDEEDEE